MKNDYLKNYLKQQTKVFKEFIVNYKNKRNIICQK